MTINAQQLGRCIICNDVDATTELIGLTITGGAAMVGGLDDYGAGAACDNAAATFRNCNFKLNTAFSRGGGMHIGLASPLALIDCPFELNETPDGPGGALVSFSPIQIVGCRFSDNRAYSDGGAVLLSGSYAMDANACLFSGNTAGVARGGAVCIVDDVTVTFGHGSFLDNTADDKGGGLYAEGTGLKTLQSCSFGGNSADGAGGGVALLGASLLAINTDIIGNTAPRGGDGYAGMGAITLQCCNVDLDHWATEFGGTIDLDHSGCGVGHRTTSWGSVKSLYR